MLVSKSPARISQEAHYNFRAGPDLTDNALPCTDTEELLDFIDLCYVVNRVILTIKSV